MKKTAKYILIIASILLVCPPVFAGDNPIKKLNRGLINIITSPVEIAKQINKEWKRDAQKEEKESAPKKIFSGLFSGISQSLKKLSSGIVDVVTFPIQPSQEKKSQKSSEKATQ